MGTSIDGGAINKEGEFLCYFLGKGGKGNIGVLAGSDRCTYAMYVQYIGAITCD